MITFNDKKWYIVDISAIDNLYQLLIAEPDGDTRSTSPELTRKKLHESELSPQQLFEVETFMLEAIGEIQRDHGFDEVQKMINSGTIWKMEDSVSRAAMATLDLGTYHLPEEQTSDYYGNTIPSRYDVQKGTKGSLLNCYKHLSTL